MIRGPQLWIAWAPLIVFASSPRWAVLAAQGSGAAADFTRATRLRRLPPEESSATIIPIDHMNDFAAQRAMNEAFEIPDVDDSWPNLADFVARGFAPELTEPPPGEWLGRGIYELPGDGRSRLKRAIGGAP